MSFDLRELYQDVILDHGKRPRNSRAIEAPSHRAEGYNPLCGDRMELFLQVEDGIITDAAFTGLGCAISTASASMMTEVLKGKTREAALGLFASFHRRVTGEGDETAGAPAGLGKLEVLSGVREFPTRVKCATLAWHTLKAALDKECEIVTTE